jgi:hypothetical protein
VNHTKLAFTRKRHISPADVELLRFGKDNRCNCSTDANLASSLEGLVIQLREPERNKLSSF